MIKLRDFFLKRLNGRDANGTTRSSGPCLLVDFGITYVETSRVLLQESLMTVMESTAVKRSQLGD